MTLLYRDFLQFYRHLLRAPLKIAPYTEKKQEEKFIFPVKILQVFNIEMEKSCKMKLIRTDLNIGAR